MLTLTRQRPSHPRRRALHDPHGQACGHRSVASDRRDRQAGALYVDLILWERQAEAAAAHLVKGQAVAFAGRFEPRTYTDRDGREHVAYELHDVMLEYGAKPRGPAATGAADADRYSASA
jgi:single-stranded DNA-binding protein